MKKSTIWLLAVVMGFAFAGLLYLQVNYVGIILKTSNEQFDSTVKRCLEEVSNMLERDEARKYMEKDMNLFIFKNAPNRQELDRSIAMESGYHHFRLESSNTFVRRFEMSTGVIRNDSSSKDVIIKGSEDYQREMWKRYQYQAELLEEVAYTMLSTAYTKPIEERVEFAVHGLDCQQG